MCCGWRPTSRTPRSPEMTSSLISSARHNTKAARVPRRERSYSPSALRRREDRARTKGVQMAVTSFKDFDLADADREWDGDAAEKRVRKWADAEDEPNQKYRDTHVWYDADNNDNFTAYKLLICDVVEGKLVTVPRAVMSAGGILQGARGGVDIPESDIDRVKSHLAKYYRKMDRTPPWED